MVLEIEVTNFSFEALPPPPPGRAILIVDTTPVKGDVYLDGINQGVAPVTLELDPGTYTISFGDVEGYVAPEEVIVTLVEGEIKEVVGEYEPVVPPTPIIPWWAVAGSVALAIYGLTRRGQ